MARNGSGTMSIDYADFQSGANIVADEPDANFSTIVEEITNSVAVDGQSTITGNIPMSNFKITGLGAGTASTDAINKGQLDAVEAGLFWKAPVVNATTANVSLTGEQTIDGILTSASRILVKDQTAPAENGIYVTAAGAWARATDMDTWAEVVSAAVQVSTGSTQSDTSWNCTSDAGGTLNTTAITVAQWGGLTGVGAGLTDTDGIVSIADDGVGPEQVAGSVNAQTGTTYTAVLTDDHKIITMSNAAANTLTVPTNASVAFPVGAKLSIWMAGAGVTTITGDTGVTINGVSAGSGDLAQYGACSIVKIATDTWLAVGLTVA